MSYNQDSPQERKTPTPAEELATGLFDSLPLVKPVRRYIKRKGKKFLQWLSVCLFVCIIVGWQIESERIDSLKGAVSSIKGQLSEVKQDRDKFQIMLSPFQALAMQVYTNVPVDKRLELLSAQFISFQTNLLSAIQLQSPSFEIYINNKLLTNGSVVSLKDNRTVDILIINVSTITAEHPTVSFRAPSGLDKSDFLGGEFWKPGFPYVLHLDNHALDFPTNANTWFWQSPDSIAAGDLKTVNSFTISTNMPWPVIGDINFSVYADRSKKQSYTCAFTFN